MSHKKIAPTLYRRIAKPILFKMHPDKAHSFVVGVMYGAGRLPGVAWLTNKILTRRHPELVVEWRGLRFSSPVGMAAGLDKNGQMVRMGQAIGFGFTEVGSVTAEPCTGNPRPWFFRLPKTGSLVVHVGLANIGVKKVLERLAKLPRRVQTDFPTILSLARTNSREASGVEEGILDYTTSLREAKDSPAVQMLEINISCPNAYGGETYTTPELLEKLLSAVDGVGVKQPVLIKMPVDLPWEQNRALINVILHHQVAGVTVANLTHDRDPDVLRDELPDEVEGALSGVPVRAKSTALVSEIYRYAGDKLMIIGVGGVLSATDAYDKIRAGATLVELATGLVFNGPFLEELNSELVELLRRDGYDSVSEAVGEGVR